MHGSRRPRPRRRLRDADDSRARILDAAVSEFAAGGYRGASVGVIARRAGMSQSGLLHHYPSKEQLLAAVIDERNVAHGDEYLEAIAEDPDLGFLTGMVRLVGRSARELDLTRLFIVVIAEATSPDHPAHQWAIDRYVSVTGMVTRELRAAQDRGLLRRDVDVDEVAATLLAVMDGLELRCLLTPVGLDIERAFATLAGQVLDDLATGTRRAAEAVAAWRARHDLPPRASG